jgi:hypothetical protein
MERMGPGVKMGAGVRARTALIGACAALLVTGCSVTVQPKHPVAAVVTPSATASPTPSAPVAPTTPKPPPKDVDHTACQAVRGAMLTAEQKVVGVDKSSKRRMGADFKEVGTALRTQAQKTKDSDLKTVLTQFAGVYETLGTDVAAGKNTDADQKKITELGPRLDELCPQKS